MLLSTRRDRRCWAVLRIGALRRGTGSAEIPAARGRGCGRGGRRSGWTGRSGRVAPRRNAQIGRGAWLEERAHALGGSEEPQRGLGVAHGGRAAVRRPWSGLRRRGPCWPLRLPRSPRRGWRSRLSSARLRCARHRHEWVVQPSRRRPRGRLGATRRGRRGPRARSSGRSRSRGRPALPSGARGLWRQLRR